MPKKIEKIGEVKVVYYADGDIILEQGNDRVIMNAEESVEIGTKIINHCYPYTRPKRDE